MELVRSKAAGPRDLGIDPASARHVYLATGRFGPYVQLGETPEKPAKGAKAAKPKRASLPKGVTEAEADLALALQLLSLPRVLGTHPAGGEDVIAGAGRFGPYVKHGDEFRSLEATDDVYTVSLDRALELLAQPKRSRRRQASAPAVLKELGAREDTGAAVRLLGRALRALCDRRQDERVASQGRRPGGVRRARGGRADRRARGGRAEEEGRAAKAQAVIHVIGGGLAGCEAAWQAASRGHQVVVHEMRPVRGTDVHHTDALAELVCSNSFRSDKLDNAVGLLKEEMRRLGSLVMRVAELVCVPAGAALAVDRQRFAELMTREITSHPLVTLVREEVIDVPDPGATGGPVVIATGPLTSPALSGKIAALVGGEHLYFYDAVSPIVLAESIDLSRVYRASRWGRGTTEGDYLNCPFTAPEYETFYQALVTAERAAVHDLDRERSSKGACRSK